MPLARFLRPPPLDPVGRAYKSAIWGIAAGITLLAAAQVGWALLAGSPQLLKDGLDWGYDVALYGLAAFVFGRGAAAERACALLVAAILAAAGLHTLYDLWDKLAAPRPISVEHIGFSAASAILVGCAVVLTLWRFRAETNPLIQATWVTARNDAVATALYASLAVVVRTAPVRWPEHLLDLFGAALCFQATFAIVQATLRDRRSGGPRSG